MEPQHGPQDETLLAEVLPQDVRSQDAHVIQTTPLEKEPTTPQPLASVADLPPSLLDLHTLHQGIDIAWSPAATGASHPLASEL